MRFFRLIIKSIIQEVMSKTYTQQNTLLTTKEYNKYNNISQNALSNSTLCFDSKKMENTNSIDCYNSIASYGSKLIREDGFSFGNCGGMYEQ